MKGNNWVKNFLAFYSSHSDQVLHSFAIFILGLFAAFFLKKLPFFLIKRSSFFKHFSPSRLAHFANISSQYIFWISFITSLTLALSPFGINPLQIVGIKILSYLPKVLGSLLIIIFGFIFANLVHHFMSHSKVLKAYLGSKNISQITYSFIILLTLLFAISQLGIDINFLTTFILIISTCLLAGGALSFGIGSASLVKNILTTHYLKKVIKVGHNIEGNGYTGRIISINNTSILIQSKEGIDVIPSKLLSQSHFRIKNVNNS